MSRIDHALTTDSKGKETLTVQLGPHEIGAEAYANDAYYLIAGGLRLRARKTIAYLKANAEKLGLIG